MSKKYERGKNFTINERNLFLNILQRYFDVIENKKTDTVWVNKKLECWKQIEKEFNASTSNVQRTLVQLKVFYDNYKRKFKKNKVQFYKTDVGTYTPNVNDERERISLLKNLIIPQTSHSDSFGDKNVIGFTSDESQTISVQKKVDGNICSDMLLENSDSVEIEIEDHVELDEILEQSLEDNPSKCTVKTNSNEIKRILKLTNESNTIDEQDFDGAQHKSKMEILDIERESVEKINALEIERKEKQIEGERILNRKRKIEVQSAIIELRIKKTELLIKRKQLSKLF